MRLSQRDQEILETLACKVRLLTLDQIASTWWNEGATPEVHARRRLMELCDEGRLKKNIVLAGRILELSAPIFVWRLGQPSPNFAGVSRELQNRWPKVAPVRTAVFMATEHTDNVFGGALTPRKARTGQVDHDLHVGELYLRLRRGDPKLAAAWVGEDARRKSGYRLKDPDAVLELDGGRTIHAVEFGGRYDADHVRDFHEDCSRRQRSYELW